MNNVCKLPLYFDVVRLRREVENLLIFTPFHPLENQICLTHRKDALNHFYDGVGGIYDREKDDFIYRERDFSEFNNNLKSWYIYEVYRQVWAHLGILPGRMRVMRLGPKSCLSLHKDTGYRFHIPIYTNSACYMIFKGGDFIHIPDDGYVYWTNTVEDHTVINGNGDADRWHIVFSEDETCSMSRSQVEAFLQRIQG